ncbi:DUF974-domain-containing protein [Hesseltinella vesiculosa]|uniref:DUF974-domain-containing protein n=1 Tax=Hesseltinella vesiculosa TaxID=101127 RepID=A0A1X2GPB5_9FUNG|nr:DUF974-domain-containing protein [Hesseltinella vesiculosa]
MAANNPYGRPNQQQEENQPHLLSLKVMRLSRPLLANHTSIFYEEQQKQMSTPLGSLSQGLDALSLSQSPSNARLDLDTGSSICIRDFGLGQMAQLPSTFGNIYLGENFSTFISLNSDATSSQDTVHDVGMKVELQTASQRFILHDTLQQPQTSMPPATNAVVTVSHEIKELGVHILVCSVQYVTPEGKTRHFRKFYKFQVSNPLAVKTKLNNLPDGRVFMEAQVQNVSGGHMFLERMKFEASEYFDFQDLNTIISTPPPDDGSVTSVFGDAIILPQDVRQYLYMLIPKMDEKGLVARTTNALGKLDIVWRTAMGDLGRLQTSQLTRKAPILEQLEVQPVDATIYLKDGTTTSADQIHLEQPFQLKLRVHNHSSQPMHLVLSADKTKMGSVLLSGLSTQDLGQVVAGQSIDAQLEFFPLAPGLQRIGGLKVTDVVSGYTKDVDHLCDVFVQ